MIDIRLIAGLCIIFISMLGYSFELRRRSQLEISFIPLVLSTCYALFIYGASLIGVMKWSVIFVQVVGWMLLLKNIIQKVEIKPFLQIYVPFCVIALLLLFYLYDKSFLLYDDFSHWGLISKVLLTKNAINNANDTVILFTSYPQAAADFIYGITRVIGQTEGLMLFSQQLFMLTGLLTFLSDQRKNHLKIVLFLLMVLFFETYVFRLPTLSVDVLLASTTFGAISFVYYYRDLLGKYWIFLLPILSALVLIKNSGIFLSMIPILLACYYLKKWEKFKILWIICALIVVRYSWMAHVKHTFADVGKHAIDFESYAEEAKLKTPEILGIIKKQFIKRIKEDYFMMMIFSYLTLLWILKKNRKMIGKLLAFTLIVYVVYQLGNYQMYRLSMPLKEALKLAGYDRYVKTIHLVLIAVILYVLASAKKVTFFGWRAFIPLSLGVACFYFSDFPYEFKKELVRTRIEDYKNHHEIKKNELVEVLVDQKKSYDYYCYLVHYEFLSKKVKVLTPKNWHKSTGKKIDHIIDAKK